MPWYKGYTLLEALENLKEPLSRKKDIDLPARMCVFGSLKISGVGTVAVGKVLTGCFKPYHKICFYYNEYKNVAPSSKTEPIKTEVKSIEKHFKALEVSLPGDIIGVALKGISARDIGSGAILQRMDQTPTGCTMVFKAKIIIVFPEWRIKRNF